MRRKIVVGVTGASGSIYAKVLLDKLAAMKQVETALVMSKNAQDVWKYELDNDDYKKLPFKLYLPNDYYAPFASGSSTFDTLIICPCSMGTLGRIAAGTSDNLICRASDVMLKERRKLICVARDTPYNLVHINNMKTVTEAGGIICPASPSFYSKPKTFEDIAATVVDRVLSLAGIENDGYKWNED
jgi:4-hydroxy-3-polyprenylbenzoate decarboxylase